jgi:hypothetical protein
VAADRLAEVSDPVAVGQKRSGSAPSFWTTPLAVQMNSANTGLPDIAPKADRSGRPSRNGRPMAIPPAPRRNARRLMRDLEGLSLMAYLAW